MNEHSREYHGVCHNPCSLRFKSSPKTKFENFLFMNDVKTEIHKRGGTSMFWISCFDWKFSLDMRTLSHMLTSPTINTTFRNFYRQKKNNLPTIDTIIDYSMYDLIKLKINYFSPMQQTMNQRIAQKKIN